MNATNFSVVSSIASLQRFGSHRQSRDAPAFKEPPPNQRDLTSTQKLTTSKDSSVQAAAIRNASIRTAPAPHASQMMTSNLTALPSVSAQLDVGVVLQLRPLEVTLQLVRIVR
jgi:hypothetical protein